MAELHNNRYALITGATSDIGYELAKLFAEDGYNLIIVARTEGDLQQRAKEFKEHYGIEAIPIVKDARDKGKILRLASSASQLPGSCQSSLSRNKSLRSFVH